MYAPPHSMPFWNFTSYLQIQTKKATTNIKLTLVIRLHEFVLKSVQIVQNSLIYCSGTKIFFLSWCNVTISSSHQKKTWMNKNKISFLFIYRCKFFKDWSKVMGYGWVAQTFLVAPNLDTGPKHESGHA